MKKVILFISILIISITTIVTINVIKAKKNNNIRNFNVDLTEIDKLMIVAHPDDEMIWGGSHLIDDNYLVVCITCGRVSERITEFQNVMKETNDKYIMLNYPDKTNGERDNWQTSYEDITLDIEKILNMRDWKLIVTHNEKGEYGHIHHIMTNSIVTSVYEKSNLQSTDLYYFGTYYKENKIKNYQDELIEISADNYKEKKDIIYKYYTSQSNVADGLSHMFKYENWIKYEKGE